MKMYLMTQEVLANLKMQFSVWSTDIFCMIYTFKMRDESGTAAITWVCCRPDAERLVATDQAGGGHPGPPPTVCADVQRDPWVNILLSAVVFIKVGSLFLCFYRWCCWCCCCCCCYCSCCCYCCCCCCCCCSFCCWWCCCCCCCCLCYYCCCFVCFVCFRLSSKYINTQQQKWVIKIKVNVKAKVKDIL